MFGKKEEVGKVGKVDTLVGPDSEIKGTISSKGTVRIDGSVDGGVANAEAIVVGADGKVKGDINAQTVVVGGKIDGNIIASASIEMLPHSQVKGDINAPQLYIAEGAVFEGNCAMSKSQEKVIEPELKSKEMK
ncbi:MAG: polymer-forming cytoskeletal protein [bacterium]